MLENLEQLIKIIRERKKSSLSESYTYKLLKDKNLSVTKVKEEVGELIAKKYDGTIECIPFPEYLKDKYQKYTCAKKEWDYKFTTVKEYLQV